MEGSRGSAGDQACWIILKKIDSEFNQVIDSCGSAGGRYPGQSIGGAGAQYQNTSLAAEGEAGSQLPAMKAQAVWKAGANYEVGWTVRQPFGAAVLSTHSQPAAAALAPHCPIGRCESIFFMQVAANHGGPL